MALQLPGYAEVNKINTKTISYTPPRLPLAPTPVDGDTTTIINKVYRYAEVITADITMADGNITTTKAGKIWTLRVHIPNALNICLLFDSFDLSSTAEMYVFDEARTSLGSCIRKSNFTYSSSIAFAGLLLDKEFSIGKIKLILQKVN